jgi:hypothetical protein
MGRYTLVAAASVISALLLTACSAGGVPAHDRLVCQSFARATSALDSHGAKSLEVFGRALTLGRQEAHRPGYLSADMAKHLRATDACNNARAIQGFKADCRAVGVNGPVWPPGPDAISC